jgi:hypothetical protein
MRWMGTSGWSAKASSARVSRAPLRDPEIPIPDGPIARTEPDGALLGQDRLLQQAKKDLASPTLANAATRLRLSASTVLIFVNSLHVTTPTRMYRTPAHSNQRARLVVASDRGY